MKPRYLIAVCLLWVCVCAVIPVNAFTADTLSITINSNGDATAVMNYELTFAEQAAIFFHAADPATQLQNAISSNFGGQATVVHADMSSAEVLVPSFASVTTSGQQTTITTPSFSFERAQQVMQQYWYASLISPHLAPQVTTITFPDGHQVTYYNQISFPSVTYQMATP